MNSISYTAVLIITLALCSIGYTEEYWKGRVYGLRRKARAPGADLVYVYDEKTNTYQYANNNNSQQRVNNGHNGNARVEKNGDNLAYNYFQQFMYNFQTQFQSAFNPLNSNSVPKIFPFANFPNINNISNPGQPNNIFFKSRFNEDEVKPLPQWNMNVQRDDPIAVSRDSVKSNTYIATNRQANEAKPAVLPVVFPTQDYRIIPKAVQLTRLQPERIIFNEPADDNIQERIWSQKPASGSETIVQQNNFGNSISNIGLKILKIMGNKETNVVFSPFSLGTVLALLQQGADGTSLNELSKTLQMTAEQSKAAFEGVTDSLKARSNKNVLAMANSVFVGRSFYINPEFKNVAESKFNALIESINFGNPASAARLINLWVRDATRGKIFTLVDADKLSPDTQIMLANAVYFKGTWSSTFAKSATFQQRFFVDPVTEVRVPFMHQYGNFRAGGDPKLNLKWLSLPFDGLEYSMLFIISEEDFGLDSMIQRMDDEGFRKIIKDQGRYNVTMSIPKFKLETNQDLISILIRMGVKRIFTTEAGLNGVGSADLPVAVNKVIQKAQIEVDETGSTAAAATGLAANTLSLDTNENEFRFNLNQPFLAILVDELNALPLFVAKVGNPAAL